MEKRITVFDVETPNCRNDRICSIGISIIADGAIVQELSYLIDPECEFDIRNTCIHGIAPEDVADAPAFPKVWEDISPYFDNAIVAAHNAVFDLSVLKKTLHHYGLPVPTISYLDTVAVSRMLLPGLEHYRLNDVCDVLGIPLHHHIASSDCHAAALILLEAYRQGMDDSTYLKDYDMGEYCRPCHTRKAVRQSDDTHCLLELKEILSLITADRKIDLAELDYLTQWVIRHRQLAGNYPYDAIYHELSKVLADGIIESSELEELLALCDKLVDPVNSACDCSESAYEICGKNVVLSGEFTHGSKSFVAELLIADGAVIQNSVTRMTNIVLVGDCGSEAWAAGSYGTKVKKALELKSKGQDIAIIREQDYFSERGDV